MTAPRGKLISLEGVEGVGKTTNLDFIQTLLEERGCDVLVSREPGGTPTGEALRELVLASDGRMLPATELLLILAARLEHIAQVIEPALHAGRWVLLDRFIDASYAYQGGGRRLGTACVDSLHRLLGIGMVPDLTLLLDLDPAVGRQRSATRGRADRIERETTAFFERVRDAYLQRAAKEPERIRVVDASGTLEQVQAAIRHAIVAV